MSSTSPHLPSVEMTSNAAHTASLTASWWQRGERFLGLIRFSHTIFALPFALLSAALAWSQPDSPFSWVQLGGILLCMVFARSAAMAFNRLVDRQLDAANPRTAGRHLPAGLLSVRFVSVVTALCAIGFIASTGLFWPNPWPLILSVPVLAWLLGYSLAKRFTALCHYWLGVALMLAPIAAWIAIRGEVTITPVLLGLVILFWVGGFDILYACQDAQFDRQAGLHSVPAWFGVPMALRVAALSHLIAAGLLFGLWGVSGLGLLFLGAVIAVAALLCYEHTLVRPDDLARVNVAFFNVNAIISGGLLLAGLLDLWWYT